MERNKPTPGERLIEAANEAVRFARGENTGARVWRVELPDVPAIRRKLGFTQQEFAARFGVSLGTLRNWEQGVRLPEGPARVLLTVIDREPEAVKRALARAAASPRKKAAKRKTAKKKAARKRA